MTAWHATAILGRVIYRIGGVQADGYDPVTVNAYTIRTGTWAPGGTVAPYPVARSYLMAVAAGGYVYATSGIAAVSANDAWAMGDTTATAHQQEPPPCILACPRCSATYHQGSTFTDWWSTWLATA